MLELQECGVENLIVLGLLPGTNIQISFVFWLVVITAGLLFASLWLVRRTHLVRNWIVTTAVLIKTHRRLSA